MSKEKDTKKAATKETAKKPNSTKTAAKASPSTKEANAAAPDKENNVVEPTNVYTRHFTREVEDLMQEFIENYEVDQNLIGTDRRRLTGAGVRNNGFMDKAMQTKSSTMCIGANRRLRGRSKRAWMKGRARGGNKSSPHPGRYVPLRATGKNFIEKPQSNSDDETSKQKGPRRNEPRPALGHHHGPRPPQHHPGPHGRRRRSRAHLHHPHGRGGRAEAGVY